MTALPEAVETKIAEMVGESTSVEMAEDYDCGAREMAEWLCEEVCNLCGSPGPGPNHEQWCAFHHAVTRAEYLRRNPK